MSVLIKKTKTGQQPSCCPNDEIPIHTNNEEDSTTTTTTTMSPSTPCVVMKQEQQQSPQTPLSNSLSCSSFHSNTTFSSLQYFSPSYPSSSSSQSPSSMDSNARNVMTCVPPLATTITTPPTSSSYFSNISPLSSSSSPPIAGKQLTYESYHQVNDEYRIHNVPKMIQQQQQQQQKSSQEEDDVCCDNSYDSDYNDDVETCDTFSPLSLSPSSIKTTESIEVRNALLQRGVGGIVRTTTGTLRPSRSISSASTSSSISSGTLSCSSSLHSFGSVYSMNDGLGMLTDSSESSNGTIYEEQEDEETTDHDRNNSMDSYEQDHDDDDDCSQRTPDLCAPLVSSSHRSAVGGRAASPTKLSSTTTITIAAGGTKTLRHRHSTITRSVPTLIPSSITSSCSTGVVKPSPTQRELEVLSLFCRPAKRRYKSFQKNKKVERRSKSSSSESLFESFVQGIIKKPRAVVMTLLLFFLSMQYATTQIQPHQVLNALMYYHKITFGTTYHFVHPVHSPTKEQVTIQRHLPITLTTNGNEKTMGAAATDSNGSSTGLLNVHNLPAAVDAVVFVALGPVVTSPFLRLSITSVIQTGQWMGPIYIITDDIPSLQVSLNQSQSLRDYSDHFVYTELPLFESTTMKPTTKTIRTLQDAASATTSSSSTSSPTTEVSSPYSSPAMVAKIIKCRLLSILPEHIQRPLYLDSDIVLGKGLQDFMTNLHQVWGDLDENNDDEHKKVQLGLVEDAKAFASGMCFGCDHWNTGIISLRRGRSESCLNAWCSELLNNHQVHTDQEALDKVIQKNEQCQYIGALDTKQHVRMMKDAFVLFGFIPTKTFNHYTGIFRPQKMKSIFRHVYQYYVKNLSDSIDVETRRAALLLLNGRSEYHFRGHPFVSHTFLRHGHKNIPVVNSVDESTDDL